MSQQPTTGVIKQTGGNNSMLSSGGNFAKGLADIFTLNAFDIDGNNDKYTFKPMNVEQQPIVNNEFDSAKFRNAMYSPTVGETQDYAMKYPNGANQFYANANKQDKMQLDKLIADGKLKLPESTYTTDQQKLMLETQKFNQDGQAYSDKMNSWSMQNKDTINNINTGVGIVQSLGNIYLGFEQLDMAKDTLAMAKEKHNETMKELNSIRAVRKNLTASYKS